MLESIKRCLVGMIIGVANIIPGVSGGTMAVVLGVYDKMIGALSNWRTQFKQSFIYLAPIGVGAGIGIVVFAKLIEYSLANFPVATNMVFIGLILGSIPMILKKTREKKGLNSGLVVFVICFALVLTLDYFSPPEDSEASATASLEQVEQAEHVGEISHVRSDATRELEVNEISPVEKERPRETMPLNAVTCIKLFLGSIIAAGAMIVPGISGSFMLVLLGLYYPILTAISDFNIPFLIPVAVGCFVGIWGCSKIIERLFMKFPKQTYWGILGLMASSVGVLFPGVVINFEFGIGGLLLVGATVGAYAFSRGE